MARKRKSIGRIYKSGSRDNKKHTTCARKVVLPSQSRTNTTASDIPVEPEVIPTGDKRIHDPSKMAMSRMYTNIVDTILDSSLSVHHKGQVLNRVLNDKRLKRIVEEYGINMKSSDDKMAVHHFGQMKK